MFKEKTNELTTESGLLKSLPDPPAGKSGWTWTEETDPGIYKKFKYLPKISILTPTFNQGEFIEQTIRSVLLQNYPNLEYIIFDAGSTDNTLEIIKKYENWITYWVSEKDDGQAHAINKGISRCTGEIFNWLNSDDYYYADCFQTLVENFDKDLHIIAGSYRFFEDRKNGNNKIVNFNLSKTVEETIASILINQPSTFFRLDILKSLGSFDERLQYVMDQDIWKKYLFRYGQDKIKILKKDLTHFRFHSNSKTFQFYFNNEYKSIFFSIAKKAGMKKHADLIEDLYSEGVRYDYDFRYSFNQKDLVLARKVINTMIFSKARSSFTENKIDLLNKCLCVIEPEWLNDYQREITFKLKVKSKLLKYKMKPLLKMITAFNNTFRAKS